MLKLPLKLFELAIDPFIICRQIFVHIFEFLVLLFILLPEVEVSIVKDRLFFLELFVILVILFFLFFQNFQIVIQFFSVQLIQCFHLFIAFFQILNIVFHFYFGGGIGLHSLYSKFLDGLFKLFFLLFSAHCEFLLHFDMSLETFLHLISRLFYVFLSFVFVGLLNFIKLLDTLIS